MDQYCPGCSRVVDRCICDEFVPAEPRASVMPAHMATIDPLFHEAALKGFEPLTDDARESFREKAETFAKVLHGGRRCSGD